MGVELPVFLCTRKEDKFFFILPVLFINRTMYCLVIISSLVAVAMAEADAAHPHAVPHHPAPYAPAPYTPAPAPYGYSPAPYTPAPYHPHEEVPPVCSKDNPKPWCLEDPEYPTYEIQKAIEYHYDSVQQMYKDVLANTDNSVDRLKEIVQETYLCP